MPPTSDWQPAIIADRNRVLKYHARDVGVVTKFCGERVRVRTNDDAGLLTVERERRRRFGCTGKSLELHPDDAQRLWPEEVAAGYAITLCDCALYLD